MQVQSLAGNVEADGEPVQMRVFDLAGVVTSDSGGMQISSLKGDIVDEQMSATTAQVKITEEDGTVRAFVPYTTTGGVRRRIRFSHRVSGTPPVDPPPGSGTGLAVEKPWNAYYGASRESDVGIAGASLQLSDLTTVTPAQLKALQATATRTGEPIRYVNCVGTLTEPIVDPGGLLYEYCRLVGMLPLTDRGPIYSSYDTYNRGFGTAGKHLFTPSYGRPRSTFRFCDIGQHGHNGELVKPWVANAAHTIGDALAYGGRVWRVLATNSTATPPTNGGTYLDLGPNPSRSVALSNYISDSVNTGAVADMNLKAPPYLTSAGASTWHIGGDPLMYGAGVWDALPGSFWTASIQEGPKLMERCLMVGGGDLTRVNKDVELQRCHLAGINRGWAGYGRISGMYPDRPETFRFHSDNTQSVGIPSGQTGPQNVLVNECYIRGMTQDGKDMANAALIAKADVGSFDTFWFTNNIVDGGGYTIYPCIPGTKAGATFKNCRFTGNRFGTPGQGYTCRYGPAGWGSGTGPQPGVIWDTTNVWTDDGITTQLDGKRIQRVRGQAVLNSTYKPTYI
jgi:hypothetical protein